MKILLALVVFLLPATSQADKTLDIGSETKWNCQTDPRVVINSGSRQFVFEGACELITINGGGNQLDIAQVVLLDVNGADNRIRVTATDEIRVHGSGNKIRYRRGITAAAPKVNARGDRNDIAREEPPASPPANDKLPDRAAEKLISYDCAKAPSLTIDSSGGTARVTGACQKITINGGRNTLTIERVKAISINGSSNHIEIGAVDRISLVGADNRVSYKRGLSRRKPKVVSVGKGNQVGEGSGDAK